MTTREMLELMGEIDERNGGRIREFLAQEREAGAQEGTTSSGAARHLPQKGDFVKSSICQSQFRPDAETADPRIGNSGTTPRGRLLGADEEAPESDPEE